MIPSEKCRAIRSIAVIAILSLNAIPARACGPFFPQAVFTHKLHPDFPLENYARGELGVLRPTYARSYLFVAYRYLTDRNLDKDEQAAVLSLWKDRLESSWPDTRQWIKDWLSARSKVNGVGAAPEIRDTFRDANQRYWYANCLEDTFRSASATLEKRVQQFGPNSAEIREWIKGQDQVLSNCAEREVIPEAIPASANSLLRADRAYQIAAAHFYAGHFDIADKLFREIADDGASPWRTIAPYLAARALVRKATLASDTIGSDQKTLARVETDLQAITRTERLKEIHSPALRLLSVVRLRTSPDARLTELAGQILKKNSGQNLQQDLSDYTWLLDRVQQPEGLSDLTDWILTYQRSGASTLEHALAKWRETKSTHWLVVLLDKTQAGQKHVEAALNAAAAIEASSPAYLTVAFHRIRLFHESGKLNEARRLLDQLLASKKLLASRSAMNLFLGRRMELAQTLDEFLKYAPRMPAVVTTGEDSQELPDDKSPYSKKSYFDNDAAYVLNRALPLESLRDASLKPSLPQQLRRELVAATWVRAVLLGNHTLGIQLKPELERLVPGLRDDLRSYATAPNANARYFTASYLILKHPGLRPYINSGVGRITQLNRIDDYKDNWWCSLAGIFQGHLSFESPSELWRQSVGSEAKEAQIKVPAPGFLTEKQKQAFKEEAAKLGNITTAPNYLGDRVLVWAKKNPNDPRVPEALHLTVKATRFGCSENVGQISRAAFQLLHTRYPKNEWTKKTPYWYQ